MISVEVMQWVSYILSLAKVDANGEEDSMEAREGEWKGREKKYSRRLTGFVYISKDMDQIKAKATEETILPIGLTIPILSIAPPSPSPFPQTTTLPRSSHQIPQHKSSPASHP